jgi:Arm domain-containing DNA-binding protein
MKYALTDTAVNNAKAKAKPYKISDGGGLYLLVSATGAKLWRYKYRIGGKEGTFAIGEYPTIGLAKARAEHAKCRDLVGDRVHPLHHRKTEELRQIADPAAALKGAVARPKVRHNAALSAKDIPALMTAMGKFGGYRTTSIAVELLLLTFVRTSTKWTAWSFTRREHAGFSPSSIPHC